MDFDEHVPDHNLWLISTFYAQRGDDFEDWWRRQGILRQRGRVEELGVPSELSGLVASNLPGVMAHYAGATDSLGEPPAADGKVSGVRVPKGDVGELLGGLVNLTAALIESYQDEIGVEFAQILVPAAEVAAASADHEARAAAYPDLKDLCRRYNVGPADIEAEGRDQGPGGDGGSRGGGGGGGVCEVDYESQVRARIARSATWMQPGPGKHVEWCRSPSVSLTVGSRRAACAAVAVVRKIMPPGMATSPSGDPVWPDGSGPPTGRRVVDLAKCLGVMGSALITMDNMVLPVSSRGGAGGVEQGGEGAALQMQPNTTV